MKRFYFIIGLLFTGFAVNAQHQPRTSQFFLNAPALNPAFTGIDDFLDLKFGFRQQWVGSEVAPRSFFVSAYTALRKTDPLTYQNKSLRISDPSLYSDKEEGAKKGLRHGVGVNLYSDQQFAIKQQLMMLHYALHLSVSDRMNLTLGTSFGLFSRKIDVAKLTARNEIDDQLFQSILANGADQTYMDINFGALLYGERFYFGIAALPIVQHLMTSSGEIEDERSEIIYNSVIGYQFFLSPKWRVQPSLILKYDQLNKLTYEANLKFRNYDIFWSGISYKSNESIALIFGTMIGDKFTIGYSYDFFFSDLITTNRSTHEVIIGLALFKSKFSKPYAW